MIGTATTVRKLGRPNWYPGTILVRLSEPIEVKSGGFLTETEFLIAAVTPEAVDHLRPETTLFAANKDGKLFGGFYDDDTWVPQFESRDDHDVEFSGQFRVVDSQDPAAALEKAGYRLDEGSTR